MRDYDVTNAGFFHAANSRRQAVHTGISSVDYADISDKYVLFEDAAQGAARFAGEEGGYFYTRVGNPNQAQAAARVALLEHAEAGMVFSSGMGAINSMFFTVLQTGDHIVADNTLYGCTYALLAHRLPRLGIHTTFVDFTDTAALKNAVRPIRASFILKRPPTQY